MPPSLSSTFALTLPSDREILISRKFAAPRRLVFEAMTSPQHLALWWGPRAMKLVECQVDFRVGGSYRYVLRDPAGTVFAFRGEYYEIVRPDKVVSSFEFEGLPGHGSTETMTLVEQHGLTLLTVRCVYQSPADRDGHLHSGMESGARDSHDRLEELIARLAAGAECASPTVG